MMLFEPHRWATLEFNRDLPVSVGYVVRLRVRAEVLAGVFESLLELGLAGFVELLLLYVF
jgi:hypothetical protein